MVLCKRSWYKVKASLLDIAGCYCICQINAWLQMPKPSDEDGDASGQGYRAQGWRLCEFDRVE